MKDFYQNTLVIVAVRSVGKYSLFCVEQPSLKELFDQTHIFNNCLENDMDNVKHILAWPTKNGNIKDDSLMPFCLSSVKPGNYFIFGNLLQ